MGVYKLDIYLDPKVACNSTYMHKEVHSSLAWRNHIKTPLLDIILSKLRRTLGKAASE
ncbi:hypothetical protein SESBI_08180 [Sesbania bispinosa]|nr:hypothetical protein SESBI_08180 [Sesbania bispinosa]